ncbi:MFS transporter [Bartonella raoultii]|uniref:MFS transporter n=1 Tax=Bartonella raoultii TaxID=1457020 RepID=A0ABS7I3V9_9HYPH|nr:MFS transporter [Bartonella raoultii]MBX4335401.1 MFS transporter [Bartonella raoultii]
MTSILTFGFLFNGIRILTGAFIVFYMLEKGLTLIDIGIIKSFQAFIMMITDIPLGYFADKKSYKISVILAAAFSATWLFLMGISTSFNGFLLAEFFNALSLTLNAGAYNALLVQYAKKTLTSTKKILGSSSQYNFIGMFIFSLIGAYFANYSNQYIWYISAFLMLITTIFGLVFLNDLKGEKKPIKEIAVILICIVFYLIKYTYLRVEVILHDSISDNLRATYESFLSTVSRLSLLVFFYISAYMVNLFGFLSLVYIFAIYLLIYLFAVFFLEKTL